jgi:isopentenyl phosphate kinase
VVLLKLGGSLITDKKRPDTARPEVIRRLAAEITQARIGPAGEGQSVQLILGHGSGSFGHTAAARLGVPEGAVPEGASHFSATPDASPEGTEDPACHPERTRRVWEGEIKEAPLPLLGRDAGPAGVSRVQERAAALHRQVVDALLAEGASPFSVAPSSALVAAGGRPVRFAAEPLLLALAAGLLPVVYGDIVMDREQGCAIASTESVFLALAEELGRRGVPVAWALWAGATDGVLGAGGERLDEVRAGRPGAAREALAAAGGAAGTDVTGGMRHRLETALELARRGIPSLVFDGTVPGRLAAALRGEAVPGTRIEP